MASVYFEVMMAASRKELKSDGEIIYRDTTFRIRCFYVKFYRSFSIGNIDYVLLPTTDITFVSPVKVV